MPETIKLVLNYLKILVTNVLNDNMNALANNNPNALVHIVESGKVPYFDVSKHAGNESMDPRGYIDWDNWRQKAHAKHLLHEAQSGQCPVCFEYYPEPNMIIEHIIPQINGGEYRMDNFQLMCWACNSLKSDTPNEDLLRRTGRLREGKQWGMR